MEKMGLELGADNQSGYDSENHEKEELRRWVAEARQRIITFLRSRGVVDSDAEDLAQDTMILAIKGIEKAVFTSREKFDSWIIKIAQNTMYNYFQGSKKRSDVMSQLDDTNESNFLDVDIHQNEHEMDPVDLLVRKESILELRSFLDALPKDKPEYRTVMEYLIQGESPEQIAQKMNVEKSKVYGIIAYARRIMSNKRDFMIGKKMKE